MPEQSNDSALKALQTQVADLQGRIKQLEDRAKKPHAARQELQQAAKRGFYGTDDPSHPGYVDAANDTEG